MEPDEVANLFVMGCSEHSSHLDGGDVTREGGMCPPTDVGESKRGRG